MNRRLHHSVFVQQQIPPNSLFSTTRFASLSPFCPFCPSFCHLTPLFPLDTRFLPVTPIIPTLTWTPGVGVPLDWKRHWKLRLIKRKEGSLGQVIRGGKRVDPAIAIGQQRPFQQARSLIVQEVFVPVAFHQRGNQYDDAAIGIFFRQFQHVLD